MYKIILGLLIFATQLNVSMSQELNCTVSVQASSQQVTVDKVVIDALEKSVRDFMNNTKWTTDQFASEERIECSILINIQKNTSNTDFEGTITVQSKRPVFNTSYTTTLINHRDKFFKFKFGQFDQLQWSENTYVSELTSVLSFYAFMIIGMDYDSYALLGGTPHFEKAVAIVTAAQSSPDDTWKSASKSDQTRYWMITNTMDQFFRPLRQLTYDYHRKGFDIMTDKLDEGRANITNSMKNLEKIHSVKPNWFNTQLFFNAKRDELINLYKTAPPQEKVVAVSLMKKLDPGNTSKYQAILTSK